MTIQCKAMLGEPNVMIEKLALMSYYLKDAELRFWPRDHLDRLFVVFP
jgi:hypothetical protein